MFFAIFFLFVLIYFALGKLKINILNPTFLYVTIWSGMVLLYQLRLFENFPKLSIETWVVIVLSSLFFVLGSISGKKIVIHKKEKVISYTYNYKRMQVIANILFLLIVVAFGLTIMIKGLPPLLGGSVPRVNYYVSGVETIYLLIFPFWFIAIYLIIRGHDKSFNGLILSVSILITLLKGNKFPLIFLIMLILFFIAKNKKITVKTILLVLSVVVIIFGLSSYFIVKSTQAIEIEQEQQLGFNFPTYLNFLMDPILYLTNNLMNLNNFLKIEPVLTFGANQLSGFLHEVGIISIFEKNLNWNEMLWNQNLQYSWLTTGTYLSSIYMDFGILGSIFEPILYGIFSGYFYSRYIQGNNNNSILTIYIYFLFFFSIVISFFTNYFEGNEILIDVLTIFIIHKVCMVKTKKYKKGSV